MHTEKNGRSEEVVSVLLAPCRLDEGEGHHDEDGASECNVDQEEVASRGVEFGTFESFDPVGQVDASRQSSLFVGGVTVCIEANIVWDLGL